MRRWYLPIVCVSIALILIGVYCIHFINAPLSDNTSDWGAWGSYVNIGISLISVSLIYITYKEQRNSNKITRFEEHHHIALKTAKELFEQKKDIVKSVYNKIEKHFCNPFDPLTDYTRDNTRKVMAYYYSSAVYDTKQDCDQLFRYFYTILISIKNDTLISEEDKFRYYTEMSCIFSEEVRTILLFWGYYTQKDFSNLYDKEVFRTSIINNECLNNIVKFACTGKRPEKKEVNLDNIDLDDHSDEQFDETYNRLFNNKNKQQ